MVLDKNQVLIVDYGNTRVSMPYRAVGNGPNWLDQDNWCHQTFKFMEWHHAWGYFYFVKEKDYMLFMLRWS